MYQHKQNRIFSRKGLTMIELLVAVSILAILILIFSRVLSQAQKVVVVSQENNKMDSSAAAIAKVLQSDMSKIVPGSGFLCIMDDSVSTSVDEDGDGNNDVYPQMRIYFSAPGQFTSKTTTAVAPALIGMGICRQNGEAIVTTHPYGMLWRTAWLLDTSTSGADIWSYTYSDIENTTRANLFSGWVTTINTSSASSAPYSPYSLTYPPAITDINRIWQYVSPNCTKLSIMWTKGDIDNNGNLIWYGRNTKGEFIQPSDFTQTTSFPPGSGEYYNSNPNLWHNNIMYTSTGMGVNAIYINPTGPDFIVDRDHDLQWKFEFNQGGKYIAFWTSDIWDTWPTALKISFTLTNGKTGNDKIEKTYEIIRYFGE